MVRIKGEKGNLAMLSDKDLTKVLQMAIDNQHPDPYKTLASAIFRVSIDEVTPAQRLFAKMEAHRFFYSAKENLAMKRMKFPINCKNGGK